METTIQCASGPVNLRRVKTWVNGRTGKLQANCSIHHCGRNVTTMIPDSYGGLMCRYDGRHACDPTKNKHYKAPEPTPDTVSSESEDETNTWNEAVTEAITEANRKDFYEAHEAITDNISKEPEDDPDTWIRGNNWWNWNGDINWSYGNTRWNSDTDWSYGYNRWNSDNSWSYGVNRMNSDPTWWNWNRDNNWSGCVNNWWNSNNWRRYDNNWSW